MKKILLVTVALALLLNGCMVGPKYKTPTAPVPAAFKEAPPAGWKEAQPNDGALRGQWWKVYSDPRLDATTASDALPKASVCRARGLARKASPAMRRSVLANREPSPLSG